MVMFTIHISKCVLPFDHEGFQQHKHLKRRILQSYFLATNSNVLWFFIYKIFTEVTVHYRSKETRNARYLSTIRERERSERVGVGKCRFCDSNNVLHLAQTVHS